jgi:flagellar basal-body rod protein FlgF
MIRGLYTSGWSMMANTKKMDVISNNLANANTNGFKKDTVVFETFPSLLTKRIHDNGALVNPTAEIGKMQEGSDVGEVYTYYTQGQLVKTDDKFSLAIQDSGDKGINEQGARSEAFFTVSVPGSDGNPKEYYTRDGSFTVNADRQLVTKDGYPVMGENGPITLDSGDFSVEADGSIIQNSGYVDKLAIKEFSDTSTLRKFGDNLVESTADSNPAGVCRTVECQHH